MNIQINCNDNVDSDSLMYVFYNKDNLIREYRENKDNPSYMKYASGKRTYYRHLKGSFMTSVNIDMTCNGKTMYFRIKES